MSNLSATAAASPCGDPSQECQACDLVDLAILPLRYALAWNGDDVPGDHRAPTLSDKFSASYPDLGQVPAHYTLRLLRASYLYVFDEQANEWTAYEVDEAGYLKPFDFFGKAPPPNTGLPHAIPCGRRAGQAMARCIKVRDPKQASRVWMAMTDTAWTEAVKQRHQDASYRKRHMRCIDVSQWVDGGTAQSHAAELGKVFKQVAEYALAAPERSFVDTEYLDSQSNQLGISKTFQPVRARYSMALIDSPYSLASADKGDFLGLLWDKTPDAPPPTPVAPMMVALEDPAGVAAELGAMMNGRLQALLNQKERLRPLAVSAAIGQMREAVGQQHVYDAIELADQGNNRQRDYIAQRTGSPALFADAAALTLSAADLKSIRDKSWDSYAAKYKTGAQQAWQQQHEVDLAKLDKNVIAPLAQAHAQLLQSTGLRNHLACNYDPAHPHSGAGYQAVVTRCLAGTQDKTPCAELYQQWLRGDITDRNNLILRAYALNLDEIADKVAEAAGSAGKLGELPWDPLIGLYAQAGERIGQNGLTGNVATLIENTVGPFATLIGTMVDGTVSAGLHALTALGVGADRPLQWVSTQATTREIVTGVMEALSDAGGREVRKRAVKLELRRLQILGVDLDERHAVGFVGIREDGSLVIRASHQSDKAEFIRKKLTGWRRLMNTEVRAGTVAAMLQTYAMVQLYKKATGGMKHERQESWLRLGAAAAGAFGGALELGGKQLERAAKANLRYARWLSNARTIGVIGKVFSGIGGFAMAALDFAHALQERKEGNHTIAALYFGSGFASALMTFAVLMSWFAIAGIFFVVVLALAIAIMWLGDTARHEWLERSLWGTIKDKSQKYGELKEEMQQYKIAVGAG